MEIYRVTNDSPEWQFHAYNYIRTDAFCFGQNIPVELEFNSDPSNEGFQGILIVDDHKPVAGLRIAFPREGIAKIERVCTVREKQKGGYGRIMIEEAEKWIAEQGYSHIVISSQDRARGFYEKCGYVLNPNVSSHEYDTAKRPAKKPDIDFKPDFVCVLVEKYLELGKVDSARDLNTVNIVKDQGVENSDTAGEDKFGFATRCIHGDNSKFGGDLTGAVSFPIYQSATFAHPEVGRSTGFDYSRLQNPTRAQVEKVVASLEGGNDALAFSSGMAAITALMELFKPGDHLITDTDLYGGSIRLFDHVCSKNGIEFTHIECGRENIEEYIKENTKAIFVETPSNPMMHVTDIVKIAGLAKRHNLLLIVDNTFLSPYFQNPIKLGADIVIHSGTKFLGGHNDTLAGFIVTSTKELSDRLRFLIKTVGSGLAPFDSWLILRGIKTLPIRMEKAQENAKAIEKYLLSRKEVKKVYYPGLGSMLTFEVESKELALHILKSIRLISFAESLGGTETLLTYPLTQTHAEVPEAVRLANGITDSVLRLSTGIEDKKDLIADLDGAFETFKG